MIDGIKISMWILLITILLAAILIGGINED